MTTYEISIWEDYYDSDPNVQRYKERRLAIIGQSNMHESGTCMEAQCRARDPKLVNNVNGTNTFTFTMYYSYVSNDTGEIEYNPYVPLLINERKIKVFWRDQWYDFVIKDMKKSSEKKMITYTCKDLFINELSKNGYNIEFADELQNNMGTAPYLADKILKDTDWEVSEASEIVEELREEAVYETATNLNGSSDLIPIITHNYRQYYLEKDRPCLVFYSTFQNRNKFLQFVYLSEGNWKTENDSILVTNGIKLNIEEKYITYQETTKTIDGINIEYIQVYYNTWLLLFEIPKYAQVSNNYRAERQVYQQLSKVDPKLNKVVDLYTAELDGETKEIYKYSHTEFDDYTVIQNIAVNPSNYTNTKGWHASIIATSSTPPSNLNLSWETEGVVPNQTTYLALSTPRSKNVQIMNMGLENNYNSINGKINSGQRYVLRTSITSIANSTIMPYIGVCNVDENGTYSYTQSTDYFTFGSAVNTNGYIEWIGTCQKEISTTDIQSEQNYCIGIQVQTIPNTPAKIKDLQFYRLVEYDEDNERKRINPGEVDKTSLKKTVEYYYYPQNSAEKVEDIKEPWVDTIYKSPGISQIAIKPNLIPQTNFKNGKYERIRSIKGEKSNRYNLLQTLAETFQCWVRFEIEHEENGAIKYDEENGRYLKNIVFKKDIGGDTGIIFSKGIDLKSLSQNYNSDQLVTKVIVAANETTIAPNGICTIQRANENPSKDSFILNFDYYTSQGLINYNELNTDLYDEILEGNLPKGYLSKLRVLNETYDNANQQNYDASLQKLKIESLKKVYWEKYLAAIDERQEKKDEYYHLTGYEWGSIDESASSPTHYNVFRITLKSTGLTYTWDGTQWSGGNEPSVISITSNQAILTYGDTSGSRGPLNSGATQIFNQANKQFTFYGFVKLNGMQWKIVTLDNKYFDLGNVYILDENLHPTIEECNSSEKIKGIAGAVCQLDSDIYGLCLLTTQDDNGTYDEQLNNLNTIISNTQNTMNSCLTMKNAADLAFWEKYSRFIQEGTWNSSDYYDDNLYYLAAENVLRTSSRPQFKFDINVISLESLDEFKLKKAHVGDIGYVEDVEFLGMTPDNLQPRRERVLISETTFNLDSPQKDAIKVQNYKTRFEDLFQRITASTESLKAQEGSFARTASQFSDDGSLKLQVLQEALTKGSSSLNFASTNDCVVKDETGITVVDTINRGNQLKVTSGGILMTEDGNNWTKVVGAKGVRPEALREGSIQADEITIMNKNNGSVGFRWTGEGIGAYTDISAPDNNFVKMNQEGITMAHNEDLSAALPTLSTWPDYLDCSDIKVRIDRETGNIKVRDIYAQNGVFSGDFYLQKTLLFNPTTKVLEYTQISLDNIPYWGLLLNDKEGFLDFGGNYALNDSLQLLFDGSILQGFFYQYNEKLYYLLTDHQLTESQISSIKRIVSLGYNPYELSIPNYASYGLPPLIYYYLLSKEVNESFPNNILYITVQSSGGGTAYMPCTIERIYIEDNKYKIEYSHEGTPTIPGSLIFTSNGAFRFTGNLVGINGSEVSNIIPKNSLLFKDVTTNQNIQIGLGRNGSEFGIITQQQGDPLFALWGANINESIIDCGEW